MASVTGQQTIITLRSEAQGGFLSAANGAASTVWPPPPSVSFLLLAEHSLEVTSNLTFGESVFMKHLNKSIDFTSST